MYLEEAIDEKSLLHNQNLNDSEECDKLLLN